MTYPTLAQCKTYMGVVGAADDTEITQMLVHAIKAVEKHTHRVFVGATATKTFFVRFPFVTRNGLQLNLYEDLVSVTTVTNGNADVVASGDYDLYPAIPYYQINIRRGKSVHWQSDGDDTPISIAGKWGYAVACPDDIFLEIMRIAALSFRAKAEGEGVAITRTGLIIDKGQWPPSTLAVLEEYIRS